MSISEKMELSSYEERKEDILEEMKGLNYDSEKSVECNK